MRLTKRYENGTFGTADTLPCGENSHDFKQLLINNLGWYEERDLARSAPETTASPSETAADKGILTEEELKQLEYENEKSFVRMLDVRKLINSHRNLLSANAELSFKNQKLYKAYDKCATGGNSLASVIIGWNLPKGWQDWSYVQANDFLHNLYGLNSNMAYERYEVWLCWKSIKEAGQTLEETK